MRGEAFEVVTGTTVVSDITDQVQAAVSRLGGSGLVHVFLPHATAGLALVETGAGSEDDLVEAVERLLPRDDRYRHAHGSIGHGADHLLPAFVSPFLVLAVEDGEIVLGTWQRICLVDTNRENHHRHVQVRLLGG